MISAVAEMYEIHLQTSGLVSGRDDHYSHLVELRGQAQAARPPDRVRSLLTDGVIIGVSNLLVRRPGARRIGPYSPLRHYLTNRPGRQWGYNAPCQLSPYSAIF